MDQIDVGGLRIAYESVGEGPPLVLLQGFVGNGRSTWQHQLSGLSDEFTVVAWDAPGAGRSSDPPASFRMPDYADCLAGFLDALSLRSVHLGGLSFGGALALEFYRRRPMVPMTLVLAGAYAGWSGSLPADVVEQRLSRSLESADLAPQEFVGSMIPTMFSEAASPDTIDEFAESMAEFHPAGFRAMARSLAEADLRDVLPRIDVPTLLMYGDKDVRAPLSVGEDLHAAIPTSSLVVLSGAGHVSSVETPELFNSELRTFLHNARR